jgi:hypothetical protein
VVVCRKKGLDQHARVFVCTRQVCVGPTCTRPLCQRCKWGSCEWKGWALVSFAVSFLGFVTVVCCRLSQVGWHLFCFETHSHIDAQQQQANSRARKRIPQPTRVLMRKPTPEDRQELFQTDILTVRRVGPPQHSTAQHSTADSIQPRFHTFMLPLPHTQAMCGVWLLPGMCLGTAGLLMAGPPHAGRRMVGTNEPRGLPGGGHLPCM